jgi:hypothetical protein
MGEILLLSRRNPGEFNMYTAILTFASAPVAYAGMSLYDVTAVMAVVFVIAMMSIGMTADIIRVESAK